MIGHTISHYKILEKLGEGGMGVVYRAEDTKLKREVALKFLPTNALQGQEEKDRFTREAQAAAALNHPNIAHIYAIDEAEEQTFIAMEFIEGQSFQDLIYIPLNPPSKGDLKKSPIEGGGRRSLAGGVSQPLSLDKAIDYATQIAAGLQAAHEKGIVHRDIKSANIMVTDKGLVKIMDFGLAKLANRSKMTQLGTTLGTAAYMSPEQARGEEADNRSDIWSLGVVLYEMICGQLPFKGDYEQAVIYSILNEEPEPLTALRSGLPIALDGIIAKALAKDPAIRYQHVDELPADLKALETAPLSNSRITTKPIGTTGRSRSNRQLKILLPLATLTGLALGWLFSMVLRPSEPALPLSSSLVFEEDAGPVADRHLALSPDDMRLAYVTSLRFDGSRLWIRDLTDGSTRPLSGTEGAERPFWSPDGSMLGYFAEGELRVVPASGGPSVSLAPAPRPLGGTWNAKGVILYNPASGPLFKIPAAGGNPTQVTKQMPGTPEHKRPVFLPDGKHFLHEGGGHIFIGDIETGETRRIREGGDPIYVEPGYLLYRLGTDIEVAAVFAQRINPERGEVSGQPIPVISNVQTPDGDAAMSVTDRTIVYVRDTQIQNSFWWRSRAGVQSDTLAHREYTWVYRISHDGRRVAFAGEHLWVYDFARNISERIPTEVTFPLDFAWSPDNSRIVYSAVSESWKLRVVQVDGTTKEETIFQSHAGSIVFPEWSPNGRTILFVHLPNETRTHRELWAFDTEKREAFPVLNGSYNVFSAQFTPNGQWYAYTSDEGGGNRDVYLRPFPGPGAPIRVSVGGGAWPRWRKDGKELFYVNGDGRLVSVQVVFAGRPSVHRAELVSGDPITSNIYLSGNLTLYDVSPDGLQFMLQQDYSLGSFTELTILRNWVEKLQERE